MKILNKITLILVAVMGIMISGCGSDDMTPLARIYAANVGQYHNKMVIELKSTCYASGGDIRESFRFDKKCFDKWKKVAKNIKLISLEGRRDCTKLPVQYPDLQHMVKYIIIESPDNCPPKNRLDKILGNNLSYTFTIQTDYGTFKYVTGDKQNASYYAPIK